MASFNFSILLETPPNLELAKLNICLNLSEIKGPVMDKLQNSKLLAHLKGRVFLTHYEATQVLPKDMNIE